LLDTNCYFVVIYKQFLCYIAVLCNNITTLSQKFNKRLCFLPRHELTLMDLSGNTGFLQQVQKVTSLGCNNMFAFDPCCLFRL